MAELDFTYPGWMDIRANADTCKGQECRFFDRCFYYRMRRAAQEASILLVNHALFFSDLVMRARGEADAKLLPDYSFVVFDEAHHLETAAAAAFGVAFSSGRLPALLDKVRRAARQMDLNLDRLKAIEAQGQALVRAVHVRAGGLSSSWRRCWAGGTACCRRGRRCRRWGRCWTGWRRNC